MATSGISGTLKEMAEKSMEIQELLKNALKIKSMLETRLSNYNPKNNKSWDEIREDI